jgi:hypothetical protein
MAFNKPANSEYKSVETHIHNTKPLVREEGSFIYHKDDFVTLRPGREHAWLDSSIEKMLRLLNCKLIEVSREMVPSESGGGLIPT